jgi:hypothetical protein
LTIADDWLEAGPNREVGQRSPPMKGSDKGDANQRFDGHYHYHSKYLPESNASFESPRRTPVCVSISKPHVQRHKNNRNVGANKRKVERPHQNILKKNTLVESIILTFSPAFIFKNSFNVTGPTALKGNNLPSGISFQLPLVCAKAASMTSANRRPVGLVTDSR